MSGQGFELQVRREGIFLKVHPEGGSLADVAAFLRERLIEDYDGQAVIQALQERPAEPVRIAARRPELDRPSEIQVQIPEDALSCSLRVLPPLGPLPWPGVEALKSFLKDHGVLEGWDEKALTDLATQKIAKQWVRVAQGRAPVHGKDAQVQYKIDLQQLRPKDVGESRVDMKELGTVVNVLKGQELAEKIPLVPGEDGITVLGKVVKAQVGKDKNLPAGNNTLLSEDKMHLFANADGHVSVKDGKLHVSPLFEVKGDVDYSVGNIQFVGPVLVKGAVREGFEVHAGGDLFVEGVVEGATLASEGDMQIKIGIRGVGKADLQAKKDVHCGYIDQARVRAGGDVAVTDLVIHSDVGARGSVVVQGKKGQIVGGKVQAGQEVVCDVLGSEMGTRTEVSVGILPELVEERRRLAENLKELQGKMAEVETNLGYLKKLEHGNMLDDQKRGLMVRLTKAKFQLQAQITMIGDRLKTLDGEMERSKLSGRVRVRNICHPGVTITIRGMTYIVRETQRFASFVVDAGEIKVKTYE